MVLGLFPVNKHHFSLLGIWNLASSWAIWNSWLAMALRNRRVYNWTHRRAFILLSATKSNPNAWLVHGT